jgi:hypothetical protein
METFFDTVMLLLTVFVFLYTAWTWGWYAGHGAGYHSGFQHGRKIGTEQANFAFRNRFKP